MARNNLAVALYFKGEYNAAKQQIERAKELGYSVDSRFVQGLNAKLEQ
jgi:Flp pilus assembly protein TadD